MDEFHKFEAGTKKKPLLRWNPLGWVTWKQGKSSCHVAAEDYFVDGWNVFDYCLVVFSVADLDTWLMWGMGVLEGIVKLAECQDVYIFVCLYKYIYRYLQNIHCNSPIYIYTHHLQYITIVCAVKYILLYVYEYTYAHVCRASPITFHSESWLLAPGCRHQFLVPNLLHLQTVKPTLCTFHLNSILCM